VIVNYRTAALAIECLRSLAPEIALLPGSRAVVVDNASGDDSDVQIAAAITGQGWSSWASSIQAGRNGGFAFGNNVGVASIPASAPQPEYVHLLNPDTRVRPGALRELLSFMDGHPDVGIAGSRLECPEGRVHRAAFRFMNLAAEFEHTVGLRIVSRLLAWRVVAPPPREEAHATDWVCGASMILRRDVLAALGGFDERYFLYFEESDLCLQARRAGWTCWHVPASRVVHLSGQATGLNDSEQPMPAYWFESRRHYLVKNHGLVYLWMMNIAWLSGYVLRRARRRLQNKPRTDKPQMLSDFIRLSFRPARIVR